MVGDAASQAKPAEPPIGQIEIDFLAKTPFRANAETITDDQHADHEVQIDGWATHVAVKGSQKGPQFAQINKPINFAQQMIARDPIAQAATRNGWSRNYPRMAGAAIRGHFACYGSATRIRVRRITDLGSQARHSLLVKVMAQHIVSLFPSRSG
jgi:hypothetical protein